MKHNHGTSKSGKINLRSPHNVVMRRQDGILVRRSTTHPSHVRPLCDDTFDMLPPGLSVHARATLDRVEISHCIRVCRTAPRVPDIMRDLRI